MTFAEKLAHAAKDDPRFARSIRRARNASWFFGAAAVLALAFAVWAVTVNFFQDTRIVKIERSPCSAHPAGKECASIRAAVALKEPIRNPCISFERVTGNKGENCPGHLLDDRRAVSGAPGGDALQPGSTGHQQPGPRGGGQGKSDHRGVEQPTSAPPASPAAPPSPAPTGSSAGPPSSPPAVAPSAKGALEHAGDTAADAAEGVKETANSATSEVGKAAEGAVCGSLAAPTCTK